MTDEPKITINGVQLTGAQAMTVRVAVTSLMLEMRQPDALGAGDVNRGIANGYRDRATEVLAIMQRPPKG
ncbi:MAG TPA: hypothetical protein VMY76_00705 [Gemmatimonadales bacterium]|nr:hypothetical protein [Gemmatimonadales bacterium]